MAPKAPYAPYAPTGTPAEHGFSFPPEWAPHKGTWISWPRPEGISFPGRYHEAIEDIAALIAVLVTREEVHLNVPNDNYERLVREFLKARRVPLRRVFFHHIPTNECWTRDHGPAFVLRKHRGRTEAAIVDWGYNAWGGKYPPFDLDRKAAARMAAALGVARIQYDVVLEGGSIDVNGAGAMLTTEQCLLNPNRNPGLSQADIEAVLREAFGVDEIVWLGDGIVGDDTDGHIDDLTRFVAERKVVTVVEPNTADPNHAPLAENLERLRAVNFNVFASRPALGMSDAVGIGIRTLFWRPSPLPHPRAEGPTP